MPSTTDQFMLDHAAEIDRAEFLSRFGRLNPDQREQCADEIEGIYDELDRIAERYAKGRDDGA